MREPTLRSLPMAPSPWRRTQPPIRKCSIMASLQYSKRNKLTTEHKGDSGHVLGPKQKGPGKCNNCPYRLTAVGAVVCDDRPIRNTNPGVGPVNIPGFNFKFLSQVQITVADGSLYGKMVGGFSRAFLHIRVHGRAIYCGA